MIEQSKPQETEGPRRHPNQEEQVREQQGIIKWADGKNYTKEIEYIEMNGKRYLPEVPINQDFVEAITPILRQQTDYQDDVPETVDTIAKFHQKAVEQAETAARLSELEKLRGKVAQDKFDGDYFAEFFDDRLKELKGVSNESE